MASRCTFEPNVLLARGKRAAAAYVLAECLNPGGPGHLNIILDRILNPAIVITDFETIDWCKWLMAGGRTPDEFSSTVRSYDIPTICGRVWTPNFVAYRCRTCGISPCMSLCTDCFKKGNHHKHDFNMFLSQAGGACDCGDTSVMKETGFCDSHGPNKCGNMKEAPADLMCVAEAMMPRIILRLIQHFRENSRSSTSDAYIEAVKEAFKFITMLSEFNKMGVLMRKVMTSALTNPQVYRSLNQIPDPPDSEYAQYLMESRLVYEEALRALPSPDVPEEYRDCPSLQEQLVHRTFLEELMFWTVKFEFPQEVVCLLLQMLPDYEYKVALTRAFVLHYSRISIMLERSADPDTLSNRVVHISVQLFSNEALAYRMTEELSLLHAMVVSLKFMMGQIVIQNTLHDPDNNMHYVVDCAQPVMKRHCYWPLVSDLNNVLSHRRVALKFLEDDSLIDMWFAFISMFQGMNVNQRELNMHVEYESDTYFAAFSCELEACAYPMWALISHLKDANTASLTRRVLSACVNALLDWFRAINFTSPSVCDSLQVSFHLPLHRYLAVFLHQAVAEQNFTVDEFLQPFDVLHLMMHPLRVQVAFYEIFNGLWVRNGVQMKGQAMTYIQCNFCNSMVDADLYLLQICCTRIPADTFLNTVIEKFHIKEWLSLTPCQTPQNDLEEEHDAPMLESFLTFLTTLVSVRTNLGLSDLGLNRLEMITLLCMSDKTHSQLMEMLPERCGTTSQSRDFEALLAEVADYKAQTLEASGNMQQGMYVPKAQVWEKQYDPVHVLLRAVHRREIQTSMDRYTEYARHTGKLKPGTTPWPPFRVPSPCGDAYEDPRKILRSKVFHAVAFVILYKAARGLVSEHVMALLIFLLEQAVLVCEKGDEGSKMCTSGSQAQSQLNDMDLANWFTSDSLSDNLRTVINKVVLTPEPEVSPTTYSSDSDLEWEGSEADNEMSNVSTEMPSNVLMIEDREWGNVGNFMAVVSAANGASGSGSSGNRTQQTPMFENLALPGPSTQPSSGGVLALPPPTTSTVMDQSLEPVMTVAIPTDMSVVSTQTVTTSVNNNNSPIPPVRSQIARLLAFAVRNDASTSTTTPSSTELVPSHSNYRPKYQYRRRQTVEDTNPPSVKVNESIISLLLKLHSQLSGIPDSYNPYDHTTTTNNDQNKTDSEESLIGDGPFFISRLLKKIATLSPQCRECIVETRDKLWPRKPDCEEEQKRRENQEREERRRRARERQQKLMAEFASKQKQFMEKAMEEEEAAAAANQMDWNNEDEVLISKQEYHCVICNQSSVSTEDRPMGLVVLVQATSVIGHRRKQGHGERGVLPTNDDENHAQRKRETLASEFDKRVEELDRHFDRQSWLLSLNFGWDGGVHVQTCGHHLHLCCLNSYLSSLRLQQNQQNIVPENGDYNCPLCRQLANSVLPLSPQLGDCAQIVRSRPSTMSQALDELSNLLKDNEPKQSASNLAEAMGKAMDDMSSSTQLKPMFKPKGEKPSPQSLFLFVTSIARTNLEVELVQRGGSLVAAASDAPSPLLPKRDCIIPLFHVLAVHARVLAMWPAWMTFQQLCGLPATAPDATALVPIEREVPLMLRDPTALLLQFVLLLPLHLDQTYFTTVVKMVYNLLYYQVVTQVSIGLTGAERAKVCSGASGGQIENLSDALALINEMLGRTDLYMEDDEAGTSQGAQVNMVALEQQVQKLCLPFLRIAALLRHHLYNQTLPDIRTPESEFVRLVYYLELVTIGMDWNYFNAAVALNWPSDTDMFKSSPNTWCSQLMPFIARSQIAARSFLMDQHILWHPPRLLELPREYEKIFTYYHERPCSQCHFIPSETSICLLCGTIVCFKQICCKQQNVCEAVAHSIECGGGTGIFLVVTSTYIVVIRSHRACMWGSLYLDDFEEEDKDLKRGKPLYLSKDRYHLLEQQWLAHRFDHTKKTWVPHRNAL